MRRISFLIVIGLLAAPALAQRPTGVHPKYSHLAGLAGRKALKVYSVPIQGKIDDGTAALVLRAARRATDWKADVLLLEIDTPGGMLAPAQRISDLLGRLQKKMLTIAFVKQNAWSAGALIALSCEFIVMRGPASIGSAHPWVVGGPEWMQEKATSALRASFRALAQTNGHSPGLAEAMVDQQVEVYEVLVDGQPRYVTPGELQQLRATHGDLSSGRVVCAKGKLLNLTAEEAGRFGLAALVAGEAEEIWKRWELDVAERKSGESSWSDRVASVLSFPLVIGLLILVGGIGLLIELTTPGFGVPGLVGLASFALLLFGKYLAGLAGAPEIALMLFGVLLLAVEVFLIPGFGVAGIAGLACVAAGLVLALQDFILPSDALQQSLLARNVLLVLSSLGFVLIGMFVAVRYLSLAPGFNRLIHGAVQSVEQGYVAAPSGLSDLQGMVGKTATPLRPAGKVEIGGRQVDVISSGEFIEAGVPVRVTRVAGSTVTVERAG